MVTRPSACLRLQMLRQQMLRQQEEVSSIARHGPVLCL